MHRPLQEAAVTRRLEAGASPYEAVLWDRLTPRAKQQVDRLARADGVELHAGSDADTLRRYINRYLTSW